MTVSRPNLAAIGLADARLRAALGSLDAYGPASHLPRLVKGIVRPTGVAHRVEVDGGSSRSLHKREMTSLLGDEIVARDTQVFTEIRRLRKTWERKNTDGRPLPAGNILAG